MFPDSEYWKEITQQCYRKYEKLVDYIAIKMEKRGKNNGISRKMEQLSQEKDLHK